MLQFCKNIVLAGVGSLTVNDDRTVTEELLSANFLIPPDENVYSGKSIAELCCDSLKDFNPMVRVSVQKGCLLNVVCSAVSCVIHFYLFLLFSLISPLNMKVRQLILISFTLKFCR